MPKKTNLISNHHFHLSNAFSTLGVRLYGSEWSGYEVWGRKTKNPTSVIDARAPLEQRLEATFVERNAKDRELKKVLSRGDIQRLNNDLRNIRSEQNEIYASLNNLGEFSDSEISDHAQWERFDKTEQLLLRAFRAGELTVQCYLGVLVNSRLWSEMPEGFGYDWQLSLMFMPESETSRRVSSGLISTAEFEAWLELQVPINATDEITISPFIQCRHWLRQLVKSGEKPGTRDQLMRQAQEMFPGLSKRAFKQAWAAEASESWKKSGAPRKA